MEHHCSTLSVDIRLGLNTWEVWKKMAPGEIIWFYLLQQTATELTSVLSAVLDVKYSLVQTVLLLTPTLLFWDTFTRNIMLAFSPSMVKVLISFSFFSISEAICVGEIRRFEKTVNSESKTKSSLSFRSGIVERARKCLLRMNVTPA